MKFLSIVVSVLLIFTMAPSVNANDTEWEYQQQLIAIAEYLERLMPAVTVSTQADLASTIADGVDWIITAQEADGHFKYEYEPFEDRYLRGDNIVRQAGTFSVLTEAYKYQLHKDPTLSDAIEKSIGYFAQMNLNEESDHGGFWCIKNSVRASTCDLGSASLMLVGLLNYIEAEPDQARRYENTIEKYLAFIKAAKFPDRGFSQRYYVDDGFSDEESPFFNGEAMLALVRYYRYQPDEEIKTMFEETFQYLEVQEHESPLYLWIMAALKDMQALWSSDSYVTYAQEFTKERLESLVRKHGTSQNYCAPLEGLVSAYVVLEQGETSDTFMNWLHNEIEYWISQTASLQLHRTSPYRVSFVGGQLRLKKTPNSEIAHGGFLTSEQTTTQRIDFTQHCVSAHLQKLTAVDLEDGW